MLFLSYHLKWNPKTLFTIVIANIARLVGTVCVEECDTSREAMLLGKFASTLGKLMKLPGVGIDKL